MSTSGTGRRGDLVAGTCQTQAAIILVISWSALRPLFSLLFAICTRKTNPASLDEHSQDHSSAVRPHSKPGVGET